jgi:uncharacterized protein HemY
LTKQALEQQPDNAIYWNTLGVGHYHNGNWKDAIEALDRAVKLGRGGTGFDFFFLAMAHWQRGEKEQARQYYDKAVRWMDKNNLQDEELRRFRAEAAALLKNEATRKAKPQ